MNKTDYNRSELRDQSEEAANLWFSVLDFVWELRGISNRFVWGARISCFGGCERRNTKQKETLICCALALVVPCGAGVALIYFT
jgi:hypothetical protein